MPASYSRACVFWFDGDNEKQMGGGALARADCSADWAPANSDAALN